MLGSSSGDADTEGVTADFTAFCAVALAFLGLVFW